MIRSILVVCLGNRCRSPMAACLLEDAFPGCHVISAGLAPPVGATADPRAVRLLAREGKDLSLHRAQALDASMVADADLVLVMDDEQRDVMEARYPQARGKTYRLCELQHADVPDPYGCSQNMFGIVLELIREGIASWTAQLGVRAPSVCHGEAS